MVQRAFIAAISTLRSTGTLAIRCEYLVFVSLRTIFEGVSQNIGRKVKIKRLLSIQTQVKNFGRSANLFLKEPWQFFLGLNLLYILYFCILLYSFKKASIVLKKLLFRSCEFRTQQCLDSACFVSFLWTTEAVSCISSCRAFLELLQKELLKQKIAFSLELIRPLDLTL